MVALFFSAELIAVGVVLWYPSASASCHPGSLCCACRHPPIPATLVLHKDIFFSAFWRYVKKCVARQTSDKKQVHIIIHAHTHIYIFIYILIFIFILIFLIDKWMCVYTIFFANPSRFDPRRIFGVTDRSAQNRAKHCSISWVWAASIFGKNKISILISQFSQNCLFGGSFSKCHCFDSHRPWTRVVHNVCCWQWQGRILHLKWRPGHT